MTFVFWLLTRERQDQPNLPDLKLWPQQQTTTTDYRLQICLSSTHIRASLRDGLIWVLDNIQGIHYWSFIKLTIILLNIYKSLNKGWSGTSHGHPGSYVHNDHNVKNVHTVHNFHNVPNVLNVHNAILSIMSIISIVLIIFPS